MNLDTIELLKECNAGARMGIQSFDEVLEHTCDSHLREILLKSRQKHQDLAEQSEGMLREACEKGKRPAPAAVAMSWIKTNAKLAMEQSDRTVANLITDGCNMGVTSLQRYLNQYIGAEHRAKVLAQKLIVVEEETAGELKEYL